MSWTERLHPRGPGGEFTSTGSGMRARSRRPDGGIDHADGGTEPGPTRRPATGERAFAAAQASGAAGLDRPIKIYAAMATAAAPNGYLGPGNKAATNAPRAWPRHQGHEQPLPGDGDRTFHVDETTGSIRALNPGEQIEHLLELTVAAGKKVGTAGPGQVTVGGDARYRVTGTTTRTLRGLRYTVIQADLL